MIQVDEGALRNSTENARHQLMVFQHSMKEAIPNIMREEGAQLANKLAEMTPPNNMGGKPGGERRLQSEINTIFKPLHNWTFGSLVMAKNWQAVEAYEFEFENENLADAYSSGNYEAIYEAFARNGHEATSENYEMIANPNTGAHKSARGSDGRSTDKRYWVTGKDARAKIDAYYQASTQAIGKMCGGWIQACIQLGGQPTVNTALMKAGVGRGSVQSMGDCNYNLVIENEHGNFDNYASRNTGMKQAQMESTEKICSLITRAMDSNGANLK